MIFLKNKIEDIANILGMNIGERYKFYLRSGKIMETEGCEYKICPAGNLVKIFYGDNSGYADIEFLYNLLTGMYVLEENRDRDEENKIKNFLDIFKGDKLFDHSEYLCVRPQSLREAKELFSLLRHTYHSFTYMKHELTPRLAEFFYNLKGKDMEYIFECNCKTIDKRLREDIEELRGEYNYNAVPYSHFNIKSATNYMEEVASILNIPIHKLEDGSFISDPIYIIKKSKDGEYWYVPYTTYKYFLLDDGFYSENQTGRCLFEEGNVLMDILKGDNGYTLSREHIETFDSRINYNKEDVITKGKKDITKSNFFSK